MGSPTLTTGNTNPGLLQLPSIQDSEVKTNLVKKAFLPTGQIMVYIRFPHTWEEISEDEKVRITAGYPVSCYNDMIRFEHGVLMPRSFIPVAETLYNFPLKEDDIWVVTFPKSGTTWTQEMVWMIVNDVNKEKGAAPLVVRSPMLEYGGMRGSTPDLTSPLTRSITDPMQYALTLPGRRVLKTHMPLAYLPPHLTKQCKVVYVARNPMDVCVSYFKHMSHMPGCGFMGEFQEFAQNFKDGLQLFGDYWSHLLSGWQVKNNPNVKFLWYEDMKRDQRKVIEDLCEFLEHPLNTTQIESLIPHLQFDNMKANVNAYPSPGCPRNFLRKGEVGDWKNFFSPSMVEDWEEWIHNMTEGTELR